MPMWDRGCPADCLSAFMTVRVRSLAPEFAKRDEPLLGLHADKRVGAGAIQRIEIWGHFSLTV